LFYSGVALPADAISENFKIFILLLMKYLAGDNCIIDAAATCSESLISKGLSHEIEIVGEFTQMERR
jgi:hypothetical protein